MGRPDAYRALSPENGAYYDGAVRIDLSKIESMIALPFHPSNAYTVHELQAHPYELLKTVEEECEKNFGGKVHLNLSEK